MARAALGAAAVAMVLAACSGGGDDSVNPADRPATADGLEAFVRDAAPQLMAGDDGTYQLLSAECRSSVTLDQWKSQLALATGFMKAFGVDTGKVSVGSVVTRNVTATEGEASVELLVDGKPFGAEQGLTSSDDTFDRYVYEDGGWRITDCDDLSGGSGDSSTPAPADGEPGSRSAPLALGTAATVGDYQVTVLNVVPDATAQIIEAGGYELPEGGNVHALVRLAVTYTGDSEGSPGFDLRVGIAGPDNRSYDSCEVSPPEAMFDEPDLLTGGKAEGSFCVTLPGDQAAQGQVFVEEGLSFGDAKTWWRQS